MTAVSWWAEEALAWEFPERIPVSRWADRYRILNRLTTSEHGPWRTRRTPYLREIMDAWADPAVEQVTMMTSTQIGKTECLLNTLGWTVDQDPGPALFVMARELDAVRLLENRVRPMVDASPQLARNLTGWASDWKTSGEVRFLRMLLYMGWAASPASLAGNPCRYVWGDEVDKWPRFSGREADPVDLMRERTRTFVGVRKIGLSSTPTTRDGRINKEFELSDRRKYWLPCPHCGAYQTLRWDRIKWPEDVRDHQEILAGDLARYLCDSCEKPISDSDKLAALEVGVWVPDGGEIDRATGEVEEPKTASSHRGYHLWAGYSPWLTWSEIASKFLEAHQSGDRARLMNFVNSWLAQLWEEEIEKPTSDAVSAAAISTYQAGDYPDEVQVLTAGVDVGKRESYVTVWGWGLDERVFLVYATKLGRDLTQVRELLGEATFGSRALRIKKAAIDSRYRRDEVFEIARDYPAVITPVRGVERQDPVAFSISKVDRHPTSGVPYRRALRVWNTNVNVFKDKVAASILTGPVLGKAKAFHTYEDPPAEFIKQMGSEHKILDRTGGRERERWVLKQTHGQNHYWDATVYAFAAAEMIHVPLMTAKRHIEARQKRTRRTAGRLGANL